MEPTTFRNPRMVALALLVLIAGGLSALLAIGRQEDPTITNLFAQITTAYPGADPARVEALVTAEIEDRLTEIPEGAELQSGSSTGVSVSNVELLETLTEDTIEGDLRLLGQSLGCMLYRYLQGDMPLPCDI